MTDGPLDLLAAWIDDATAAGLPAPSAMALATTGEHGAAARTVLVTALDATTLRFHSSAPTGKTRDLAADPRASGVFHWPALGRQVVLSGRVVELDAAVSDAAFGTRPRPLQLVAWAYESLPPDADGAVPVGAVEAAFTAAALDPASTARPGSWTTLSLAPDRLDFWRAGTDTTPPQRTRHLLDPAGWRSFPVLP